MIKPLDLASPLGYVGRAVVSDLVGCQGKVKSCFSRSGAMPTCERFSLDSGDYGK